jgi:hypothetical protein
MWVHACDQANAQYWDKYRVESKRFIKIKSKGSVDYNQNGTCVLLQGIINLYKGKSTVEAKADSILFNGYTYTYDGCSACKIINNKLFINAIEQKPISYFNPLIYAKQMCFWLFSND